MTKKTLIAAVALLAVLFVLFRILHGLIYIAGWQHAMRSLAWTAAFACVAILFVLAALQVA